MSDDLIDAVAQARLAEIRQTQDEQERGGRAMAWYNQDIVTLLAALDALAAQPAVTPPTTCATCGHDRLSHRWDRHECEWGGCYCRAFAAAPVTPPTDTTPHVEDWVTPVTVRVIYDAATPPTDTTRADFTDAALTEFASLRESLSTAEEQVRRATRERDAAEERARTAEAAVAEVVALRQRIEFGDENHVDWLNDMCERLEPWLVEDDVAQEALIGDAIDRLRAALADVREAIAQAIDYLVVEVETDDLYGHGWNDALHSLRNRLDATLARNGEKP